MLSKIFRHFGPALCVSNPEMSKGHFQYKISSSKWIGTLRDLGPEFLGLNLKLKRW
jgi:hypothetical protein